MSEWITPLMEEWFVARDGYQLRTNYDLSPESIVVDVGAYFGKWSAEMNELYGCRPYVFEPAEMCHETLREMEGAEQIHFFQVGLGGSNRSSILYINKDSSSAVIVSPQELEIKIRRVSEMFRELGLDQIDLITINIEGMEYELLEDLLDSGTVPDIRFIQIQFHDCVPGDIQRREHIRNELKRTHNEQYCYDFIWESWERK
jgi:FkbM family methyltransferase